MWTQLGFNFARFGSGSDPVPAHDTVRHTVCRRCAGPLVDDSEAFFNLYKNPYSRGLLGEKKKLQRLDQNLSLIHI